MSKTIAQMQAEFTAALPTNGVGAITAAVLRTAINNFIAEVFQGQGLYEGDINLNGHGFTNVGSPTTARPGATLGYGPTFKTKAEAQASGIDNTTVKWLNLAGYTTVGDDGAGAVYKYVASMPSHQGRLQTLDGSWFELVPVYGFVTPGMFGAAGDASQTGTGTDDATAVTDWWNYLVYQTTIKGPAIGKLTRRYAINSLVSLSMSAGDSGGQYRIFADRPYSGGFVITNSGGGLKITSNNPKQSLEIFFTSMEPGIGASTGTAYGYWLVGPASGSQSRNALRMIGNVFIPLDSSQTFWFVNPLVTTGWKRPRYMLNVVDMSDDVPLVLNGRGNAALDISECYQPEIFWNRLGGSYTYGIYEQNTSSTEGFFCWYNKIVSPLHSIYLKRTDNREPGCQIIGNHLNAPYRTIYLDGVDSGEIAGNLMFQGTTATWAFTYSMDGAGLVTVTSNFDHLLATGNQVRAQISTGTAVTGTYTITVTDSKHFTYNQGAAAATSGVLTLGWSDRASFDIGLINAENIDIHDNQYKSSDNRGRRHVLFDTALASAGLPVSRSNQVHNDQLIAQTSVEPFILAATATDNVIKLPMITPTTNGASYIFSLVSDAGVNTQLTRDLWRQMITTPVGNVGGGTDDLQTYTIPAYTLYQGLRAIKVKASGITANNGTAKTVTLNLGGSTIATLALTTAVAGNWDIEAVVFATGAATQRYWSRVDDGNANTPAIANGTLALDATTALTIKCTGTAGADDDIKQTTFLVEIL